ncbi:MAG: hypothetical protein H0T13_06620 [Actinobacteria bacterium]|nr:hypothetical protein [Actinomycetota bacterium]
MARIEPIEMEAASGKAKEQPEGRCMVTYLAWAAAIGAAGCGRCATAV